ncbi:UPF0545 protein C22orf39 homolog [Cylas formicarius]|uniref:UPF0545 protein C22orf39 homolog n=1 Tax=Cylas formicarius TaxID=197179 RepID=UPI00295867B2|nr:UPF0545 protein C22orf39 homolog [Cylas formicarius]
MSSENNRPAECIEDEWLIRNCQVYDEEYSDCTSIKARFHQYFIFGHMINCSQWKRDSINCYKWTEKKDVNAGKELIESEKEKRKDRLLNHVRNNIWKRRKEPPENWNCPLPEYLQKEYENSYLNVKSKEIKGELPPSMDLNTGSCTIL